MKKMIKANRKYLIVFSIIVLSAFLSACNGVAPTSYTITTTHGTGGTISPFGSITIAE